MSINSIECFVSEVSIDAIVGIDSRGLIKIFNPAAEVLFQYSKQEMMGKQLNNILPKEMIDPHKNYVHSFMKSGKPDNAINKTVELTARKKSGELFPIELSLSVGELEDETHVLGVIRDITEKKLLYEKLKDINICLEAKVQEKVEALLEAERKVQIKEKLAFLGEITANIIHDLRGPLSVIKNAIYCVRGGLEKQAYLDLMDQELERISNMINQIRINTKVGGIHKTEFDLNLLLQKIVSSIDNNISVFIDSIDEAMVFADKSQIEICVENIIANAIDALTENEKKIIKFVFEKLEGFVWLRILDNGPGIEEKNMDKIFDPYFTTKSTGMGLGLSNVRKMIRENGGSIQVRNNEKIGVEVILSFPQI